MMLIMCQLQNTDFYAFWDNSHPYAKNILLYLKDNVFLHQKYDKKVAKIIQKIQWNQQRIRL
jgi:hypothetical protein